MTEDDKKEEETMRKNKEDEHTGKGTEEKQCGELLRALQFNDKVQFETLPTQGLRALYFNYKVNFETLPTQGQEALEIMVLQNPNTESPNRKSLFCATKPRNL
jgi:hypothetical protein